LANKTDVDIKSYIDGLAISPLITKCKGNQPKKSIYSKFMPIEKENDVNNDSQSTSDNYNHDNLNISSIKNLFNSIMKDRNSYI